MARHELEPLGFESVQLAEVLIVGKTERSVTLEFKAPLVINLYCRLGRQVIANGDLPIQYELGDQLPALKKSAANRRK